MHWEGKRLWSRNKFKIIASHRYVNLHTIGLLDNLTRLGKPNRHAIHGPRLQSHPNRIYIQNRWQGGIERTSTPSTIHVNPFSLRGICFEFHHRPCLVLCVFLLYIPGPFPYVTSLPSYFNSIVACSKQIVSTSDHRIDVCKKKGQKRYTSKDCSRT